MTFSPSFQKSAAKSIDRYHISISSISEAISVVGKFFESRFTLVAFRSGTVTRSMPELGKDSLPELGLEARSIAALG